MLTYEEASRLFDTARSPEKGKPIANNTRLYKRGDEFEIVLHQTAVVSILPEGKYIIRTGGWNTLTTRDRLNRYAPGRFFTEQGILYWVPGWAAGIPGEKIVVEEGMIIGEEGQVYEHDAARAEAYVREVRQTKKLINNYIDGYIRALEKGMPVPSGGDCWYCCMRTEEGRTLGDQTGDHLHLREHLEERYFVPTLMFLALEEAGYPHPGVFVEHDGETMTVRKHDRAPIRRSLRAYLQRRLIPGAAGGPTVGDEYDPAGGFA
jgi:hypothetical protein